MERFISGSVFANKKCTDDRCTTVTEEIYGVKGLSTPTVLAAQARKQSLKTECACAPSLNPTRGILGHWRKIASPLRLPGAALNRFPTLFGKELGAVNEVLVFLQNHNGIAGAHAGRQRIRS